MASYLDIMAQEWGDRAEELAAWAFERLVNRTDVWGAYLAREKRFATGLGRYAVMLTAPFSAARGKTVLTKTLLRKHFMASTEKQLISLHSTSADNTSRWFGIDVDRHQEDDPVTAEQTFAAARGWFEALTALGFDPLLMDSNGAGGFHVLVVFERPIPTGEVYAFSQHIIADWEKRGLSACPETYPRQHRVDSYGNCLRLPGRHHSRPHYTRVYNSEDPGLDAWLDGSAAITRILETRLASPSLIPRDIPEVVAKPSKAKKLSHRRSVCIDFDGVLASYDKWMGLDFVGEPLPGAVEFTKRISEFADVIVFTTRCCVEAHREEMNEPSRPVYDLAPRLAHLIRYWLEKHDFAFHDVYVGQGKPPASAYVDDRAVVCRPQDGGDAFALALQNVRELCGEKPKLDPRLAEIAAAWPELSEEKRTKVHAALKKKK